jgi:hypothetical protein
MSWRGMALLGALAAAATVAACGSDDGPSPLTRIAIETTDPSSDRVAMRAPKTAAAGPVEIVLRNRGDMLHDAQLLRVDGDRTALEVAAMLEQSDAQSKPRWVHPAGGVAPTEPGETASVRQVLEPGTYFVVDTQERPTASVGKLTNAGKKGIARIEVSGDGDGELPKTPATIAAREYGYRTSGIVAGTNRVTFRNTGKQFHQVVAFPIPAGNSFRAGKGAVLDRELETGWVPVDVPNERATTVLEGGGEQVTELTFRPGRYVLLCFVSDRDGGSAQWTLGMASKLTVDASEPRAQAASGP